MSGESAPVVVRRYAWEHEALIAQGVLEAEGIPSAIQRGDSGGMHPALAFVHGVRLLVRHEDAVRALRCLESLEAEAGDAADDPAA